VADIRRGGYVLQDVANAQAVLIATGSEIELAVKAAAQRLAGEGIAVRVCRFRRPMSSIGRMHPTRPASCPRACRAVRSKPA